MVAPGLHDGVPFSGAGVAAAGNVIPPAMASAEGTALFFAGPDGLVRWANTAGQQIVSAGGYWARTLHLAEAPVTPAAFPVAWTGPDCVERTGLLTIESLLGGTLGAITDVSAAPAEAITAAGQEPALTRARAWQHRLAGGALAEALERNELHLQFQPIIDMQSGSIVAAEAVIRWPHLRPGYLSHDEVLSLGQDSRSDLTLVRWLFDGAVQQAGRWAADPSLERAVGVHVTVTASQLASGELAEHAAAAIARTSLAPRALCVQVSERALSEPRGGPAVHDGLRAVRDRGIRAGLTHFGTGVASLAQLQLDPVDVLRLDVSLVQATTIDGAARAIVATVLTLSETLGLETVAAGVGGANQVDVLRSLGCRHALGPHLAAPMGPAAFAAAAASSWASAAPGSADADVDGSGHLTQQALAGSQHAHP